MVHLEVSVFVVFCSALVLTFRQLHAFDDSYFFFFFFNCMHILDLIDIASFIEVSLDKETCFQS